MNIVPFQGKYIEEAAAMFAARFKQQRQAVPILPARMEDPSVTATLLEWLMGQQTGLAAFENGNLVGYLGWLQAREFRGTQRTGAYCPEWGHAAAADRQALVYRALYREAAALWAAAGAQVHAITLLADDENVINTWFWNGFGLTVVDAVRPLSEALRPDTALPVGVLVRKASASDVENLTALDSEHCRHYGEPPTLMVPPRPETAQDFVKFIGTPPNSIWLVIHGGEPAGFMRFQARISGASEIVCGDGVIGITGAYVRQQHRGAGLAASLLNSAMHDYRRQGFTCCAVDFESFNPEAAAFWTRFFTPVALSVIRVPEK
jgi:GNAT superfamily N-acetyltransferase